MDYAKDKTKNIKHDFKLKNAIFPFSSLTLICFTVIYALVVYDVLAIPNLLSFDNPKESLIISGVASVGLLLFGVILTLTIPEDYIDDTNKTYQNERFPDVFIFMFVAVLFEETLFRGIIQNLLLIFTGHQWVAILLTALLFIAFHFHYFKKPIMLLNICIPSLVFSWIYFKTNNILVPIFVHFVLNFGITILFKYKLISFKR